jgi:hypothetical protein
MTTVAEVLALTCAESPGEEKKKALSICDCGRTVWQGPPFRIEAPSVSVGVSHLGRQRNRQRSIKIKSHGDMERFVFANPHSATAK